MKYIKAKKELQVSTGTYKQSMYVEKNEKTDEHQSLDAAYEEAKSAFKTIKTQVEKMDNLIKCQEDIALGRPKAQECNGGEAQDRSSPRGISHDPLCHSPLHTPTPSRANR